MTRYLPIKVLRIRRYSEYALGWITMKCRPSCGACCIAPSISSALPNMPNGKKAGELCANIDPITFACSVWGTDLYPKVCGDFKPSYESCGADRDEALKTLTFFEKETTPNN